MYVLHRKMELSRLKFVFFVLLLVATFAIAEDQHETQEENKKNAEEKTPQQEADLSQNFENKTAVNTDKQNKTIPYEDPFSQNSGMLKRAFYVALACSGIVVVYFGIKLMCRRKKKKERRYGLLTSNDIEMNDVDDSDEDRTLFDASQAQTL